MHNDAHGPDPIESSKLFVTPITEKFGYQAFKEKYKNSVVVPLFLIDENKKLIILTSGNQPAPQPNQELISLIKPN